MSLLLLPPQWPAALMRSAPPTPVPQPTLLALNRPLALQLRLDAVALATPAGAAVLAGNAPALGTEPVALAYAGHQFGSFVPQLGDGRAILLGEALGTDQRRYDVQLKGAGRTPFSRSGDGRAALGPVLREYVVSEAMAALGVPTTRSLAAVLTGAPVFRETVLPGAVLTRVAASHLRIGTFQYFAARQDRQTLAELTEFALDRHFPAIDRTGGAALALLGGVMAGQARLIAQWLGFGFVHGVMNTDNMSIGGETLDYGPCAFMDSFDPARTFSSIDHGGRYAYANQPQIAQWNLVRLAECLLPLVNADADRATEVVLAKLAEFTGLFETAYADVFRRKLGLFESRNGNGELARALLAILAAERVDFTSFFRGLATCMAGHEPLDHRFADSGLWQGWWQQWHARRNLEQRPAAEHAALMRTANPAFIARNHRVEEMIAAAMQGDLGPFERLNRVLSRPFDDQPDAADLAEPPGAAQWQYRTFCGT
ncbi:MAG: YdiU family protein [Myxococcales bacterium]|nr:YdiU family protein [Myxococcales bacterium]